MMEILTEAFMPINVVLTVLLLLAVLYWFAVILGLLDIAFLDFDLPDAGLDADMDIDADADADVEADGPSGNVGQSILHFFYVGEIPIMVLFSVFILTMWVVSMIANHYINPTRSLLLALPIFAGNLVVSLMFCKTLGMPLKRLFAVFDIDKNAPRKIIGRICRITTTTVSSQLGQAEVPTRGAPILLNVVTEDGSVLKKGDEAVVVSKDENRGVYLVAPVNLDVSQQSP